VSADNYIGVWEDGSRWCVGMGFASDDRKPKAEKSYDTRAGALDAAADWLEEEPVVEYGIVML
jgi:hypothetical protein